MNSDGAHDRNKDLSSRQGYGLPVSDYSAALPELSIDKCQSYDLAKDSFTEVVLLTVISYFCVSTEQRFINMNNEKKLKSNRSLLNHSNRSIPNSMKSAGVHSASVLNSTLQRSTKTDTANSSTQRQLGQNHQGAAEPRLLNLGSQDQLFSVGSAQTIRGTKEAEQTKSEES